MTRRWIAGIAVLRLQARADVRQRRGENYLYDPEISAMEKDGRFLDFIDVVRGHMQAENRWDNEK